MIAMSSRGHLKIPETAVSLSVSVSWGHVKGPLLTGSLVMPSEVALLALVVGVGKAPSGYDPSCSSRRNSMGRFETKSGNSEGL